MNNLTIFEFENKKMSVLLDKENNPWFIGKEITKLLNYADQDKTIRSHCEDAIDYLTFKNERGGELVVTNEIKHLQPHTKIIPESDLYALIFKSQKPEAKIFRNWINKEVLPSIRKTGQYNILNNFDIPKTYGEALKLTSDLQLKLEEKNKLLTEQQPKIDFCNYIEAKEHSLIISDFAKMLSDAHNIKIGPNKLFKYLRDHKYLMEGRSIRETNKPYAQYSMSGIGYFDLTYVKTTVGSVPQTLITVNGQIQLADQIVEAFRN